MKTIVIPDVHQRIQDVRKILIEEKDYDEVVFLGDWFDSFFEPPKVASFEETCEYLRHLVLEHHNKDKFVFLLGNHDVGYIYENKNFSDRPISKTLKYFCSGFTASKAKKFRKQFFDRGLKDEFFTNYFKPAHRTQNWTLSHAGLQPEHIPVGYDVDKVVNELLPEVWRNFRNLEFNHNWLISGAGIARGGNCKIGGVLWCDWNMEFRANKDIGKQVVGHTICREPSVEAMNTDYETWNLDTEKFYGIILNGRLTTKSIPDFPSKYKLSSRVTNLNNYGGTIKHDS
jgi:hypothetical protein